MPSVSWKQLCPRPFFIPRSYLKLGVSMDKIENEKSFHNERFANSVDPRAVLDKWYRAVRYGSEKQDAFVLERSAGKKVLEYGCSDGGYSVDFLRLPEKCTFLTGIDISDVAIEKVEAPSAQPPDVVHGRQEAIKLPQTPPPEPWINCPARSVLS